jgi:hypothetical protein
MLRMLDIHAVHALLDANATSTRQGALMKPRLANAARRMWPSTTSWVPSTHGRTSTARSPEVQLGPR